MISKVRNVGSKVCPEQIDFFSVTVEESDLVSKGGFVVLDIESKVIFPVTFDSKFMGEFGTNPDANQGNDQTEYNTEKPHPTFRDFIGKVWNYLYKEVHSSPIKSGLYWFIILVIPAWIVAFIMPDSYFTKVSKNVPFVHRD